jgi:hypothetical protein
VWVGPGNKTFVASSRELQGYPPPRERTSTGSSSGSGFGWLVLLVLFILWQQHANAGSSGGTRLAPGTYQLNLNTSTNIGQFWITSLQVDPSNSVRLTGSYVNTTDKITPFYCGIVNKDGTIGTGGTYGSITFSDGTSLGVPDHTCVGYEGKQFNIGPGETFNRYIVFPASDEFTSESSVRVQWGDRQWSFYLPSTPSSS